MCVRLSPVLQWGVVVNDTSGSGGGRTATLSLHQLLSGGKTSLAAEYTLPLNGELAPVPEASSSTGVGCKRAIVKHHPQGMCCSAVWQKAGAPRWCLELRMALCFWSLYCMGLCNVLYCKKSQLWPLWSLTAITATTVLVVCLVSLLQARCRAAPLVVSPTTSLSVQHSAWPQGAW